MLKSYGVVWFGGVGLVAHGILVSAQVLLVLTMGLWTLDSGLTIFRIAGLEGWRVWEQRPHLSNKDLLRSKAWFFSGIARLLLQALVTFILSVDENQRASPGWPLRCLTGWKRHQWFTIRVSVNQVRFRIVKTSDFMIFISSRAHHWRRWCRWKAVCGDFSPWLWHFLLPSAFSWISKSPYSRWAPKVWRQRDTEILSYMEFWHRFLGPGYWFTHSGQS